MPASEAEKKFWNCRELVERLFVNLDISSLAALLEAHKPIIGILTKSSVTWNNLTRRTVAGWDEAKDLSYIEPGGSVRRVILIDGCCDGTQTKRST